MAKVILFKEPTPSKKEHGHMTETVNGIQIPGQEPIFFHKRFTAQAGSEHPHNSSAAMYTPEILTLREEMAKRLGEFCINYLLCEDGDDFNCRTFVDFVGGYGDKMESRATFWRDYHISDPVKSMETGRSYVAASDTAILHAMIGTHRPTYGLSITQNGAPLELIDTETMHRMYHSKKVCAIYSTTPSAPPSNYQGENKSS